MDFKILYTQRALGDLEEIFDWSWARHPATTERFGNSLLSHIDLLKSFPNMGTPLKRYPNVRRLLHSPLHVYYSVHHDQRTIEILHFRHFSRTQPIF